MQVSINESQRAEIEEILRKDGSDLADLFKEQDFNCLEYLIRAKVIERKYLDQPAQQPLLERYVKAYEQLGKQRFTGTVLRCTYMNEHSQTKIKSLRGYTINALEKEVKKYKKEG